jgi:hypothetical protein
MVKISYNKNVRVFMNFFQRPVDGKKEAVSDVPVCDGLGRRGCGWLISTT